MNAVTGKAELTAKYAPRTINHQLSVLFGFYEHACAADLGPLVNPVPAQRARHGGRPYAHHNPMEDFKIFRRANYRQKTPGRCGERSPTMLPQRCSTRCVVTATERW